MDTRLAFPERLKFTKCVFYKLSPIPLPVPFQDGTGGVRRASLFGDWFRLFDSEGWSGEGPCTALTRDYFIPKLLDGVGRTNLEWRKYLYREIRNFGYQSAHVRELGAVDYAMLDLLARRAGKPLHRFLGAEQDWCRAYKGGGSILLSDEELTADLLRFQAEGYGTVKFKVGGGEYSRDIRRLEKVRAALGDEMEIAVDANQAWDAETAFQFAKAAAPMSPAWLEEPVHAFDMDSLRLLRDQLDEAGISTPIAMGESVRSYHMYAAYVKSGVGHLQPPGFRIGPAVENLAVLELARRSGTRLSSGGFPFQNAVLGALYGEDGLVEYHQPINEALVPYLRLQPARHGERWELPETPGSPVRLDFERLERDGLLAGVQYFYL